MPIGTAASLIISGVLSLASAGAKAGAASKRGRDQREQELADAQKQNDEFNTELYEGQKEADRQFKMQEGNIEDQRDLMQTEQGNARVQQGDIENQQRQGVIAGLSSSPLGNEVNFDIERRNRARL